MSQSATHGRGESSSIRPNEQANKALMQGVDPSADDNAPVMVVVDEACSDTTTAMRRPGDSQLMFTAENGSSSREYQIPPRSRSLSTTTTSACNDQLANSSLALRSPPPTQPNLSTSRQSPQAKTRNRGYSLRRSLFSKNIQSQPGSNGMGMGMELESQESSPMRLSSTTTPGKNEKGQSSVTVSTLVVGEDSSVASEPTHYGRTGATRRLAHKTPRLLQPCPPLFHMLRSAFHTVARALLRMNEIPPTANGRHINLDFSDPSIPIDERTGVPYVNNIIRSSRYTLLNFFPRQLLAQFSKLANFYFLIVSVLQMIPGLSTTGTYTTIVPLLVFVGISMAKEGYDDIRRWRLDKEENNRDTLILARQWHSNRDDQAQWKSTKWRDVKVGDVLLLRRNDAIPADLVVLHADDPSQAAHLETMALDGETNLKMKQPVLPLGEACGSPKAIAECRASLTVEDPNLDLYNFDGKVSIGSETVPLTNTQILYRGSVLRNTVTATGLVIFTGEECKIRMNANKHPRIKAPALQSIANRVVVIVVLIVVALAIFNSAAYQVWQRTTESKSWYLQLAHVAFGPIFTSFIIMFNTMIPLSLYVSLEIVKLCQMFFLNMDVDMYDEESNTPMEARTSTINEELGQVSYIFSDKTGTLTENSMRFRQMSIAGTAWLHERDLPNEAQHTSGTTKPLFQQRNDKGKHQKDDLPKLAPSRKSTAMMAQKSGSVFDGARPSGLSSTRRTSTGPPPRLVRGGRSEEMLAYIKRRPDTIFARKVRLFLLSLALCHTCVPETDEEGNVGFQAASPDELALVKAAQDLGYVVVHRQSTSITIKVWSDTSEGPSYETFEVLDVIEFTAARKRMSVIVRMPDRRICIFCKGADSTVTRLLRMSQLASTLVGDIQRKNEQRKSLEAQVALRRRGQHVSLGAETARKSFSFARTSVGAGRPLSPSLGRNNSSLRDSVDHWLRDRETDGVMRSPRESAQYYSPRLSQQPRSPDQGIKQPSPMNEPEQLPLANDDDDDDDLVDEALVANDHLVLERCFHHINDFATEGLRTLMYGYRQVSEEEYAGWKQIYSKATTSLVDRQIMIEKAADRIEGQLELVGATAIEDKLQRGVPDAIDRLRRAGIKLWMLTGDKRETAMNIGHACRLVKEYSTVVVLDHKQGDVARRLAQALAHVRRGQVAHSVIVVDGQTLSLIEAEAAMKELFIELAICADSVICSRASPSQKASLVRAIRNKVRGSVTLAVGDGANDIAMIQEAHVGIGITGKEGLQAARTSDYSIAQFRFLLKLLLVQGRWNYVRICKYTLGTFWKEMLFYLTQASYQRYNGYTGTSFYEPWSLSMFNTLFTSLPVIFMGVFEQDLAASTLLAAPELYSIGQRNGSFTIQIYLWWAFLAACEAVLIFNTVHAIYGNALFTTDNGLFATGALAFTCCITVISIELQVLELHNKSIAAVIAIVLSVGGWYLWNILLALIYHNNVIYTVKDGILQRFGRNMLWWLTMIVVVVLFVVFEMAVRTIRSTIFPTDVDVFQGYEQDPEVRKRFAEAAASYLRDGWDGGRQKSSLELMREAAQEAEREQHIEELLQRPRTMTNEPKDGSQMRKRSSWPVEEHVEMARLGQDRETEMAPKKSLDTAELLFSRGFGSVKEGPDLR